MSQVTDQLSRTFIVRELRRALRHLYDPDELRSSALMRILPLAKRDGAAGLQQLLIAAIQALQPAPGVSPQSNAWRTHHILVSRYVQQFQQGEIAEGLSLSLRQLRRQDGLAVRTLMEYLWSTYDLQSRVEELRGASYSAAEQTGASDSNVLTRQEELDWLASSVSKQPVYVQQLLEPLRETIAPLTQRTGVELGCQYPEGLPPVAVALTPTREALLTLLTAAVRSVPGGAVRLTAGTRGDRVTIEVHSSPAALDASPHDTLLPEELDIARELIDLSGGKIQVVPAEDHGALPSFVVTLPNDLRPVALIVDDNQDALRLFERYLSGTRYAFVGTDDPNQAVELALRTKARVVVIDVMLPQVGGWELLARLREHPELKGIPIIVCTILPQESLALALGAAAYLRKPVTREQLLAALDAQLARPCRGSH